MTYPRKHFQSTFSRKKANSDQAHPMHTTPVRQAFAPSSTVIRYLRAQNSSAPFFTQNHSAKDCLRSRRHEQQLAPNSITPQSRRLATISVSPLQSSLGSIFQPWWLSRKSSSAKESDTPPRTTSISPQHEIHHFSPPCTRAQSTINTPERKIDKDRASRLSKFWSRHMRQRTPLEPNDLPDRTGFLDDGLGRPLRPANELKLRCTEFDENGNVVLVNGEFRKTELIAKVIHSMCTAPCSYLIHLRSTASFLAISARSTHPSFPPSSFVPLPYL